MQQPINNFLEKAMNEMKKMALEMNTMADLWKTYEPQNEFEGAAVETMIGLLRASSLLFLMLQKETPTRKSRGPKGATASEPLELDNRSI